MKIHLKDPLYLDNKKFYENHFHQMKLTSFLIKYLMKKYMSNLKNNKEKKQKQKDKIMENKKDNSNNSVKINIEENKK